MKLFFCDLLRMVFPQRCILCNQILLENDPVCEKCKKEIIPHQIMHQTESSYCMAVFGYSGVVRDSIIRFKFHGYREYAAFYGRKMAEVFLKSAENNVPDLLVPVPLSKRRLKKRGYNQATLLAREMEKVLAIPCKECLQKVKNNAQQHDLNKARRQSNVKGVYRVLPDFSVKGKKILLVDDIVTTGATLDECAKVLYENGALQVVYIAIACSETG